jgi:RIO kinase 1
MDDHTVARGDKYQDKLESTVYNSFGLGLTRDTRATVDQVLDPKTVEVLLKLQKQAIFGELAGCISTGKEANVYFGVNEDGSNVAVKVYKTSILGFRDRDEYVDGEYRFRHGYCKSNPRKMVSLWAEKEQRNLIRLRNAGIHCPSVLKCTRNVLVMSLVGVPGRAAPRLKDVSREPSIGWLGVYLDVIRSMRKMFQVCKLVHGDLSEYNMLLDDSDKVFVIDVSQSVGLDHPRSLEFLKRDCFNINAFFERLVATIPLQELFRFIVTPVFKEHQDQTNLCDSAEVYLPSKDQTLSASEEARLSFLLENRDSILSPQVDDSVFLQTWVPSSLAEAGDLFEIERIMQERSQGLGSVYDTLLNTPEKVEEEDEGDDDDDDDEEDCSKDSLSDGVSSSSGESPNGCDGHRPDNMTKQEWKKLVKEQNREKRKNKVSKYRKQKRNLKKYGCK